MKTLKDVLSNGGRLSYGRAWMYYDVDRAEFVILETPYRARHNMQLGSAQNESAALCLFSRLVLGETA